MAETQAFVNETPDYKICKQNQDAMQKYMVDNKLAWNRKNLKLAFESLAADALVEVEETNALPSEGTQVTPEEPQPVEPIAPATPSVVTRPRGTQSSALFRDHSSAIPAGGAGGRKASDDEFAKQLAKMSQVDLRRNLGDPKFRARLDALGKK